MSDMDITEFVVGQLDREDRIIDDWSSMLSTGAAIPAHPDVIRLINPGTMRARVEVRRAVLALHRPEPSFGGQFACSTCATTEVAGDLEADPFPCQTVRLLAAPYGGQPGWDDAWKPQAT